MKGRKEKVIVGFGCLWMVYCAIAILIFAPYYNYKFAQKYSFGAWFFGGEITSTLRAVAWPYFLWKDHAYEIQRKEAKAYFDAVDKCGTGHPDLNAMLNDAASRASERSKMLGADEGSKLLTAAFQKHLRRYTKMWKRWQKLLLRLYFKIFTTSLWKMDAKWQISMNKCIPPNTPGMIQEWTSCTRNSNLWENGLCRN